MINTGNLRRENTQAYLIPLLQQAGFNVVPDNGYGRGGLPAAAAGARLRHGDVHQHGRRRTRST